MKSNSLPTCTAQLRSGKFCDRPSADDMPFPICEHHARQVYRRMHETIQAQIGPFSSEAFSLAGLIPVEEQLANAERAEARRKHEGRRQDALDQQSVVYYLQEQSGEIKIGYTTNLKARLIALRVSPSDVLATEPGGARLEKMRHGQFKHLRVGRWERFKPALDLLSHIEMIRDHFGAPSITTYPKVS